MHIEKREVDFEKHCKTCEHRDLKENENPCDECLENFSNTDTDKPVFWKGKNEK